MTVPPSDFVPAEGSFFFSVFCLFVVFIFGGGFSVLRLIDGNKNDLQTTMSPVVKCKVHAAGYVG